MYRDGFVETMKFVERNIARPHFGDFCLGELRDVREALIWRPVEPDGKKQFMNANMADEVLWDLRSSTEHAAFEEMVLAQGLGHADRQTPRDEKGNRGPGTSIGRDHAPHRVPVDAECCSSVRAEQDQLG
jgi:hypothetical protein